MGAMMVNAAKKQSFESEKVAHQKMMDEMTGLQKDYDNKAANERRSLNDLNKTQIALSGVEKGYEAQIETMNGLGTKNQKLKD
ncbi:hypothetical protein Dimus_013322 [Dionaea muscipula]